MEAEIASHENMVISLISKLHRVSNDSFYKEEAADAASRLNRDWGHLKTFASEKNKKIREFVYHLKVSRLSDGFSFRVRSSSSSSIEEQDWRFCHIRFFMLNFVCFFRCFVLYFCNTERCIIRHVNPHQKTAVKLPRFVRCVNAMEDSVWSGLISSPTHSLILCCI